MADSSDWNWNEPMNFIKANTAIEAEEFVEVDVGGYVKRLAEELLGEGMLIVKLRMTLEDKNGHQYTASLDIQDRNDTLTDMESDDD